MRYSAYVVNRESGANSNIPSDGHNPKISLPGSDDWVAARAKRPVRSIPREAALEPVADFRGGPALLRVQTGPALEDNALGVLAQQGRVDFGEVRLVPVQDDQTRNLDPTQGSAALVIVAGLVGQVEGVVLPFLGHPFAVECFLHVG